MSRGGERRKDRHQKKADLFDYFESRVERVDYAEQGWPQVHGSQQPHVDLLWGLG